MPVKGGSEMQSYNTKNSIEISMLNPNRKPIYCYAKNEINVFELVQIVQSSTIFAKIFNKNKAWVAYKLQKNNGFIINNFIISLKPIEIYDEALISHEVFINHINKVTTDKFYKNRKGYFVFLEKDNIKIGPYKSLNYVCKNMLDNANWDTVKKCIDLNIKYKGYTITIYM